MRNFKNLNSVTSEYLKGLLPDLNTITNIELHLRVTPSTEYQTVRIVITSAKVGSTEYITFRLSMFPGCCAGLVLHDIQFELFNSTGFIPALLDRILKAATDIAFISGYSRVYYSTIASQDHLIKALSRAEFSPDTAYSSQRTLATITFWYKTVADKSTEMHDPLF